MLIKGRYIASNFILTQEIEVDLEKKCFSKFTVLFSFIKFRHACEPLPKVDYVLLFKTLYYKCESCRVDDVDKYGIIQLSLVHNKNRKFIVNESVDLENSKELAKQLASSLNVNIRDSATDRRHPMWINS